MERITNPAAVYETNHRDGTTMAHHRHDAPYATVVLRGSYVEVRDAVPQRCLAGSIVVHASGEEHADRFAGETRCLNIELPLSVRGYRHCGTIALDAPLREAVAEVVRCFYHGSPELSKAIGAIQWMLDVREKKEEPPAWLSHVIERFPWADGISLRSAARLAGVHETHFSRTFRRYVGMTASEYRSRERLRRASALLLETVMPLARVAAGCGFSDQSHLTRAFTDRLGLTPAGYRRTFTR